MKKENFVKTDADNLPFYVLGAAMLTAILAMFFKLFA